MFNKTLKFWIRVAEEKKIPVHFMRFEDLTTDPIPVLKGLAEFMMDVDSVEGTYIEERVIDAANPEKKAS